MKKMMRILSAFAALLLVLSCERRELVEVSNTHYVRVYVNEDIQNVTKGYYNESYARPEYKSPSVIRVTLTDPDTGSLVAERYLRDQGEDEHGHYYDGYIIANPGYYKLMAYNFDTQTTLISSSNNHYEMNAYTNEIASHLYTKIPSRVKSMDNVEIVYDPDHLMVADCGDLYIPYTDQIDTLRTPEGEYFLAETIVKSYFMQIKVKGAQYISSAVSLLEGVSRSARLHDRQVNQDTPAILYFEMLSDKDRSRVAKDEAVIYATFGMFGRIDGAANNLEVTFDFLTTYGQPYNVTFDISDQFDTPEALEHQWLLLDHLVIEIPDPPKNPNTSGGFAPSVDEWSDVNSDIIL